MHKPLIGITTSEAEVPSPEPFLRPVTLVNQAYVDLVTSQGAIPLLLSPRIALSEVQRIASLIDGLILIGGQDIDPAMWGEKLKVAYERGIKGMGQPFLRPMEYRPCLTRDRFEIALYQAAKERSLPILGICRGLQLINVAEGGSLYQELPEPQAVLHARSNDGWIHYHPITIDRDSAIFRFMQVESYIMSSIHHQGIERLGPALRKAAWSEDGIIEMIERVEKDTFIVGVHGHIEQTRQNLKLYDKILEAFIMRAGASYAVRSEPSSQRDPALP